MSMREWQRKRGRKSAMVKAYCVTFTQWLDVEEGEDFVVLEQLEGWNVA
jgi:hypothetical protein